MVAKPLNILLIGGSGFVSGTLASTAVKAGHKTWTVTRGEKPLPEGVVWIKCDRHDRQAFEKAVVEQETSWDLVVDCIGYDVEDARQDISVFRERARHLVFISTDFVFEPTQRKFPQNDDNFHFLKEGYGGKKRLCELELLNGDTGSMVWTVFRPCHIYGPGSQLGCLPEHSRDPDLIAKMKAGVPLRLVGGGHFLQQPLFVSDLAELILSCADNQKSFYQIYTAGGPDIIESREYYCIITDIIGVELKFEEILITQYLTENPDKRSFLCHRIYDLNRMRDDGLKVPSKPIKEGLREHVMSLANEIKDRTLNDTRRSITSNGRVACSLLRPLRRYLLRRKGLRKTLLPRLVGEVEGLYRHVQRKAVVDGCQSERCHRGGGR